MFLSTQYLTILLRIKWFDVNKHVLMCFNVATSGGRSEGSTPPRQTLLTHCTGKAMFRARRVEAITSTTFSDDPRA